MEKGGWGGGDIVYEKTYSGLTKQHFKKIFFGYTESTRISFYYKNKRGWGGGYGDS
jgi:hypothetical protein